MVAAGSANSQRPKQQRDARPRNGLIVLMVLKKIKDKKKTTIWSSANTLIKSGGHWIRTSGYLTISAV